MDTAMIPPLNVVLNGFSIILLMLGFGAIRRGERPAHKRFMLSALACSLLYLACFLWYHSRVGQAYFGGQGWTRPLYFVILVSHTLLMGAVPAFAAYLLIMVFGGRLDKHKAAARWAFPVWMYVCFTAVILYYLRSFFYIPPS